MIRFYIRLLLTLTTIVVVTTTSVSANGDTNKNGNPIYKLRDSVISYFYPVSGVVTGVEKGLVKVKFHTGKKLREGMRFSIFREGKPFYHPVTKELVGRAETFIGKIEIKKPANGEYLCTVTEGATEVGDIVRISSSKIRLAFFQHRKTDWELSEMFYNSLKESGRFIIIDSYTKTYEPEKLSKIAKGLDAEISILLSSYSKDGKLYLNSRLIWSEDSKVFAEIEEPVGADLLGTLKTEETFVSITTATGEPWGSHELAAGRLIVMGDVDGDGVKELVISDGNNIRIYDFKEEPKEIWAIKGNPQEEHLSIDVLDVNNNGRAEIFVTSMMGEDTMSSYVLEYDTSEGYRKIWEKAPYFFRVIGETLLMQAFTHGETYSEHVYKAVWKNSRYQMSDPLNLPRQVNIYGFTFIDWGEKGEYQILAIDDKGYLNLYKGKELIWSSKDSYGGFDISFEKKTSSIANPVEKWFVKGRLISIKTQRGQEVIVIKRIPFLAMVPGLGYKSAEVYSLWWDGAMIDEGLILKNVSGTVTDYWVEGKTLFLIARTNLSNLLLNTLSGNFSKGSVLYYYYQFEK
ncbi:MAG: VCBS repeat-containing protein [Nitrospirae bacterium]|nr:VCBS repeat-containing protein [Nitrospirota bacterium]